jgi:hypothetical protein
MPAAGDCREMTKLVERLGSVKGRRRKHEAGFDNRSFFVSVPRLQR